MNNEFVICPYCNRKLKFINSTHLKLHNKTSEELRKDFPNIPIMSSNMRNKILKGALKNKRSIKYIRNYLFQNKIPYTILSAEYKNSYSKLKWKCNMDHIFYMTWTEFQQGNRCFECFGSKKKTVEEVEQIITDAGYNWISETYKNIYSKLELMCDRGHLYKTRYDQFQAGHRCPHCHHEDNIIKFTGSGNPNWRGGISYEPYCSIWTNDLKDFIRFRDGDVCLNPCCKSLNKSNLVIHHINYIKKDCDPINLITLCNTCNTEANFNRKWHTSWYESIIYRRYFSNVKKDR